MTVTREQWAKRLLERADWPVSRNNLRALVAWTSAEGTKAKWNPLATTQPMAGATDFNSVGVKNYPSLESGLEATLKTLAYTDLGYGRIRKRLKENAPAYRTLRAVEKSAWGTGGLALRVLNSMRTGNYNTYADGLVYK